MKKQYSLIVHHGIVIFIPIAQNNIVISILLVFLLRCRIAASSSLLIRSKRSISEALYVAVFVKPTIFSIDSM